MGHTRATPLGRSVFHDDWMGLARDQLVVELYRIRDEQGSRAGLMLVDIERVIGRSKMDALALLNQLTRHKPVLVEWILPGIYVLTERGVRWVEESPARAYGPSAL